MNQQALERIIVILLAEIEHLQDVVTARAQLINNCRSELDRLEDENERLVTELAALRKNMATVVPAKRPVGRPKGSKNKKKVVA